MKDARKESLLRRQEAMMEMEDPAYAQTGGGGGGEGLYNLMISESMRDVSLLHSMSSGHRYAAPNHMAAAGALQLSHSHAAEGRTINLAAISEGIGEDPSVHEVRGGGGVDEPTVPA